jgi:hypothetical protein
MLEVLFIQRESLESPNEGIAVKELPLLELYDVIRLARGLKIDADDDQDKVDVMEVPEEFVVLTRTIFDHEVDENTIEAKFWSLHQENNSSEIDQETSLRYQTMITKLTKEKLHDWILCQQTFVDNRLNAWKYKQDKKWKTLFDFLD